MRSQKEKNIFYADLSSKYILINDLSYKKLNNDITGNNFNRLSKELAISIHQVEMLLNNNGYNVGQLYLQKTNLYLASIGELYNPKSQKTRQLHLYIAEQIMLELEPETFKYK